MSSSIVALFVDDAPPGELPEVARQIRTIVPQSKGDLNAALDAYPLNHLLVVTLAGEPVVVSHHTRLALGKYVDHALGKQFNVDLASGTALDVEPHGEGLDARHRVLQSELQEYVASHYPLAAAVAVVPQGSATTVLVYGYKFSEGNMYHGAWALEYTWELGRFTKAAVQVDIHYFEDGNVRMRSSPVVAVPQEAAFEGIVAQIGEWENGAEAEVLAAVAKLSESEFKSLRRLMPVTRARIQWGRSMGNYRMGRHAAGAE